MHLGPRDSQSRRVSVQPPIQLVQTVEDGGGSLLGEMVAPRGLAQDDRLDSWRDSGLIRFCFQAGNIIGREV